MKLGKLPARKDAVKFKLTHYADTTTLPTPPKKYGHQSLISNWMVLGNDRYGNCVWAGADHESMLWNAEAGKNVEYSAANALSDYSAATGFNPSDPNTDNGTDMQAAASYRQKTGVIDQKGTRHKIGAYVAIRPGDKEQLKLALYLFGAVGIGFEFPSSAMSQFNQGKNWTIVRNSPIEGGHYVPGIAYDGRYVYVVSWGRVVKMSWGFYQKYCDEAVAYVSQEFLKGGKSLEGFDISQLNADLAQLNKGGL